MPGDEAALCDHASPELSDADALPDDYSSEGSDLGTSSPAPSDTDDGEFGLLECAIRDDAEAATPDPVWVPSEIIMERWVRGQRQYRVRCMRNRNGDAQQPMIASDCSAT